TGTAIGVGAYVAAGGNAHLYSGRTYGFAQSGDHGYSLAIGAEVLGSLGATADNDNNITGTARTGDYGTANSFGLYVLSNGTAGVLNAGDIDSVSTSGFDGNS